MHFLLTVLNVVYVLNIPKLEETEDDEYLKATHHKMNFLKQLIYGGHIMNGMYNVLFDTYLNFELVKARAMRLFRV